MVIQQPPMYRLVNGGRSIFDEIYFPKKADYQGEIFEALKFGLNKEKVITYLQDALLESLVEELSVYPDLLDLQQYERLHQPTHHYTINKDDASKRINMYESHFKGWSMYEVDGVFLFEDTGDIGEDRTQVIRLIFRLESSFQEEALQRGCSDVLEAIITWSMSDRGRIDTTLPWGNKEKQRFLAFHSPWTSYKKEFADQFFVPVTKEVKKWIDDTALFIFGYLMRKFWVRVSELGRREEEIWLTSFFNLNVNILQRIEQK